MGIENVDFEHWHGVWANGFVPEPVDPKLKKFSYVPWDGLEQGYPPPETLVGSSHAALRQI